MKIKGADIIRFMAEWPVPEGVYIVEAPFEEDGDPSVLRWVEGCEFDEYDMAPAVDPAAMYDVKWGSFGWQGSSPPPSGFEWDIGRHLRKWLKAQTETSFAVTVPNEQVEEFRALCMARGWKVR